MCFVGKNYFDILRSDRFEAFVVVIDVWRNVVSTQTDVGAGHVIIHSRFRRQRLIWTGGQADDNVWVGTNGRNYMRFQQLAVVLPIQM